MKIHQLYESNETQVPDNKIQFGGLHYHYRRFEIDNNTFNFIHFNNSSGRINVHLSNYVSTPASTDEILEPTISYESVGQLHSVIKKSLVMTEGLIPKSMKSETLKCWYLLRSDDLESLEADMEGFKTDAVNAVVEFEERTKFSGQNYNKFIVTFNPE